MQLVSLSSSRDVFLWNAKYLVAAYVVVFLGIDKLNLQSLDLKSMTRKDLCFCATSKLSRSLQCKPRQAGIDLLF